MTFRSGRSWLSRSTADPRRHPQRSARGSAGWWRSRPTAPPGSADADDYVVLTGQPGTPLFHGQARRKVSPMLRRVVLALSLLGGLALPLGAQTRLIIGRVDDSLTTNHVESGSVKMLGTRLETPINYDGTFVLYVPVREVTLRVEVPGYQPREVRVAGNMQAIQISILKDYFRMEQVIVTAQGGGGVDRRNLAHAIGEVHGDEL